MAIPVLAEIPGQQELHTRDHGTVKVAGLSFIDGGFHIVKCPNGAYMHANGLPVQDEDQIIAAIPNPFREDALKWFNQRLQFEENPAQPIGFHPQGYPIFADGSIPEFSDLYAYFAPGPILTAAIVALQNYLEKVPPQKLKVADEPAQTAPAPDPGLSALASLTARLEVAEQVASDAVKAAASEKALRLTAEKATKAKKSTKAPAKSTKPAKTAPAPATE